jgi:tetratricopeptide (TPR) repeat protein
MRLYEFEKALAVYKKAEKINPKDKAVLKDIAEILYHIGNYEESFKYYEILITQNPGLDILESYAVLAEALGQLNKLAQSIEMRITLSTNIVAWDYHQLAFSRKLLGQNNSFIATLKEGLNRFPNDASLRLQTVLALQETEQFNQAAEYLIQHPELKNNSELMQMYVGLLVRSQKLKEAQLFFTREVPEKFRSHPGLLESEAYVYETLKQPEKSLQIYAKLRKIDPDEIRYTANYARMLCLTGRYKEALPFVPLIEKGADKERFHLLAQIHSAAAKYKLAENYQKQYIALQPDDLPQAWGFLGDIYLSRGEKTLAKRAYQRGLEEIRKGLGLKSSL